jgi:hypothetical protein
VTQKPVRGKKPGKNQERLSLAPLTPEEALKRMLGDPKETRPESMVPRGKPKSPKKGP